MRSKNKILHKTINIDITLDNNSEFHHQTFLEHQFVQKMLLYPQNILFPDALPEKSSNKKTYNHVKFKKIVKNYKMNSGVT